jgi:hypothetical protein
MPTKKMRHCCYCGAELGFYSDADWDPRDTCGFRECEREMRQIERGEREEAHRRLDEDRGW